MHIWSNLTSFLYDKENFIALYDNKIYFYNFLSVLKLNSETITLKFSNKTITIQGHNLKPIKCLKGELMIEGKIEEVKINEWMDKNWSNNNQP